MPVSTANQVGTAVLGGTIGHWQLILILFVVLLLFGRRLPGLARSLGQGISSFKKGLNDPLESSDDGEAAKSGKKKVLAEAADEDA